MTAALAHIRRTAKDAGKRGLRGLFELGQRAHVNVLPTHFYSQIPDIAALRADDSWRRPRSMVGVRGAGLDQQLAFAAACCAPEVVRQMGKDGAMYDEACRANGAVGYGPIEAEFLYCFIATRRPRRVLQVGAGVSTAIILRAARRHAVPIELICVDPFPTNFLVAAAARGEITLLAERAQDVALDTLTDLSADDLLFVDSTHTVKPGSEVNRLILEVLPRLARGVYVQFHDIWWPYDHPWAILRDDLFFWSESVLLHALMTHNERYSLRVAMSMLHDADPLGLQQLLPGYRPAQCKDGLLISTASGDHLPAAAYFEVVGV